jgi:arginyl-tRNA--protein-N-Asp/Glu arginylyltransferase
MECKYSGFFWPASKRRHYREHCENCRNLVSRSARCVLELDPKGEVARILVSLAGQKKLPEAVDVIRRYIVYTLYLLEPDHYLVEWYDRSFRKWRRQQHRKFLESLRPEEELVYRLLSPEERESWEKKWILRSSGGD